LFGLPPDIGWKVGNYVRKSLGVKPIWTLASSKLVSKVASRLVKPVGEYIVGVGEENEFLAPLPVDLLPGISAKELRTLKELNLTLIGQLMGLSRSQLLVLFGSRGAVIYGLCRGVDDKFVGVEEAEGQSISCEHQFASDTNDRQQVRSVVGDLVSRAAGLLRQRRQLSRRVGIRIDYSDGTIVGRRVIGKLGSSSDDVLLRLALLALRRAWWRRTRLRSCTLIFDRLHKRSPQLLLFPECGEVEEKQKKILEAMDRIRCQFGHNAVRRVGRL